MRITKHVRSWLAGALAALFATAAAIATAAEEPCSVERVAELPVTMNGTQPIIKGTVNGVPAEFVADSGAFFSFLGSDTVDRFHLHPRELPRGLVIAGATGATLAKVATANTLTLAGLGDLAFKDVDFIIAAGSPGRADGFIGQNLLGVVDTEYDLANGVIRLFRVKGCRDRILAYWHSPQPVASTDIGAMTPLEPHLIGRGMLNGKPIRMVFDTGATVSTLTLKAAARAGLTPDSAGVTEAGMRGGIGSGRRESWIGRFDSLDLGGEEIRNARLRFADLDLPRGADMLLGADFFLSHRVFVAKSQRRIYYTYNGGPVFDLGIRERPADSDAPAATHAPTGAADAPADAASLRRHGAAAVARSDIRGALADFDEALRLDPQDSETYYQRALAYVQDKQPARAAADLDRALELRPDHAQAQLVRGHLRLRLHDDPGARADFAAVVARDPKNAALRLDVAHAYNAEDRFADAIAQYDEWIRTNPHDPAAPAAYLGRCWARGSLGTDLDAALADCTKALRIGQRTSDALNCRALVWIRRGEPGKAMDDLQASLKLQPRSAWALYALGVVELRQGRTADSERHRQAALALDQDIERGFRLRGLAPPEPPAAHIDPAAGP